MRFLAYLLPILCIVQIDSNRVELNVNAGRKSAKVVPTITRKSNGDTTVNIHSEGRFDIKIEYMGQGSFEINPESIVSHPKGSVYSKTLEFAEFTANRTIVITITGPEVHHTIITVDTTDKKPDRLVAIDSVWVDSKCVPDTEDRQNEPKINKPVEFNGTIIGQQGEEVKIKKSDEWPTYEQIIGGHYPDPAPKNLKLTSVVMNRKTFNRFDTYFSKNNVYNIPSTRREDGQIIFYVTGRGNKTVTIKSIAKNAIILEAMVYKVTDGYAAFWYFSDDTKVNVDEWVAKIENDKGDIMYKYIRVTRANRR